MPMINSRKRRSRTSSSKDKSQSHSAPQKIVVLDNRFSFDGTSEARFVADTRPKDGVKVGFRTRLRRGSSRLLSIFRISSTNSKATTAGSNSDARPDIVEPFNAPIQQRLSPPSSEESTHSVAVANTNGQPISPGHLTLLDYALGRLSPLPSIRSFRNHRRIQRSKSSAHVRRQQSSSLRRSQSSPGLSHKLSHRFSATFGHPTIVHRADLRSRPSVRSMSETANDNNLIETTETQDSTNTSSQVNTGASSSQRASTNATTDSSPLLQGRSASLKLSPVEGSKTLIVSRPERAERALAPIAEQPVVDIPSVITVEATAIAKIFFETHFNDLLCKRSPRSQRRQELEDRLYALNMSLEAKNRVRQAWARRESETLRQDRVWRSRASRFRKVKGVSIGGYDIVKVLGKGSFGVVRLVRESRPSSPEKQVSSRPSSPSKRLSITDIAYIRASARQLVPRSKNPVKYRREVYAMKVIRKADMLRNCQEGHLRAERDLLVASANQNSRWVVPLIASFQDTKNLYLVMEYCVGGDFLGLLIRKNILSQDVTRWYVAEMVLCVEEAHRMRWIHRDVKPDNFLITASGHLKISDFGLAFDGEWAHDQTFFNKHRSSLMDRVGINIEGDEQDRNEAHASHLRAKVAQMIHPKDAAKKDVDGPHGDEKILDWRNRAQRRKLARSVVGTSQYMAPEVIRGELYDGRCDWWSIGIIIYECLYGYTPFACENRQDTKLKILRHKETLQFPADQNVSHEAVDLIFAILQEKEYRLCSRKYLLNDFVRDNRHLQQHSVGVIGQGRHLRGANALIPADKMHKDYLGYFVYTDDADEIKSHPFFRGIRWNELHLQRPPFVPRVKSWDDTKYFDDDEPVSDIESDTDSDEVERQSVPVRKNKGPTSVESHHHENQHIIPSAPYGKDQINHPSSPSDDTRAGKVTNNAVNERSMTPHPLFATIPTDGATIGFSPLSTNPLQAPTRPSGVNPLTPQASDDLADLTDNEYRPAVNHEGFPALFALPSPPSREPGSPQGPSQPTSPTKAKREKKRPRDKALRDPDVGKAILEIRKRGSFIGYDWKNPSSRGIGEAFEEVVKEEEEQRLKDQRRMTADWLQAERLEAGSRSPSYRSARSVRTVSSRCVGGLRG